jgi:hypothetical protein
MYGVASQPSHHSKVIAAAGSGAGLWLDRSGSSNGITPWPPSSAWIWNW